MSTYPEMIAQRIVKQASAARIPPERLLLQELLDMQRAYMLSLEIILKESQHEDSTDR